MLQYPTEWIPTSAQTSIPFLISAQRSLNRSPLAHGDLQYPKCINKEQKLIVIISTIKLKFVKQVLVNHIVQVLPARQALTSIKIYVLITPFSPHKPHYQRSDSQLHAGCRCHHCPGPSPIQVDTCRGGATLCQHTGMGQVRDGICMQYGNVHRIVVCEAVACDALFIHILMY